MKKVKLVCIGRVKNAAIRELISEYEKRLSPYCKIEGIELRDEGKDKEGDSLLRHVTQEAYILDERGREATSLDFSEIINRAEKEIIFIIGGPDGIREDVKKKGKLIAISRMTFTHELARLLLTEQIYRAFMILNRRPYHK